MVYGFRDDKSKAEIGFEVVELNSGATVSRGGTVALSAPLSSFDGNDVVVFELKNRITGQTTYHYYYNECLISDLTSKTGNDKLRVKLPAIVIGSGTGGTIYYLCNFAVTVTNSSSLKVETDYIYSFNAGAQVDSVDNSSETKLRVYVKKAK